MAMALTILLWMCVALGGVVALVIFTPMWLYVRVATGRPPVIRCDVRAVGGWAPRVTIFQGPAPDPKQRAAPKAQAPPRNRPAPAGRSARIARALPALFGEVLRQLHFAQLKVECEFGFDDPADTGQIAGSVFALVHGLPPSPRFDISARPNFQRPCLEGEASAALTLTVAAFVGPVARFAWRVLGPVR